MTWYYCSNPAHAKPLIYQSNAAAPNANQGFHRLVKYLMFS